MVVFVTWRVYPTWSGAAAKVRSRESRSFEMTHGVLIGEAHRNHGRFDVIALGLNPLGAFGDSLGNSVSEKTNPRHVTHAGLPGNSNLSSTCWSVMI